MQNQTNVGTSVYTSAYLPADQARTRESEICADIFQSILHHKVQQGDIQFQDCDVEDMQRQLRSVVEMALSTYSSLYGPLSNSSATPSSPTGGTRTAGPQHGMGVDDILEMPLRGQGQPAHPMYSMHPAAAPHYGLAIHQTAATARVASPHLLASQQHASRGPTRAKAAAAAAYAMGRPRSGPALGGAAGGVQYAVSAISLNPATAMPPRAQHGRFVAAVGGALPVMHPPVAAAGGFGHSHSPVREDQLAYIGVMPMGAAEGYAFGTAAPALAPPHYNPMTSRGAAEGGFYGRGNLGYGGGRNNDFDGGS